MQTHHDIPTHLKEGLDAYVAQGVPLGSFLAAVVSNDLIDSFARADETSTHYMQAICGYVYSKLPAESQGSREIYRGWIRFKQLDLDGQESQARDAFMSLIAMRQRMQSERHE